MLLCLRLRVLPALLSGENIKRRLQFLGARPTREQGHLPLTGRQMRRPEAGLHQANLLNVSGTLFGGRPHTWNLRPERLVFTEQ